MKKKIFLVVLSFVFFLGVLSKPIFVNANEQIVYFIGDDTLKGLESVSESSSRFSWRYESRKGYSWLNAHAEEWARLGNSEKSIVVFSIGLSETSNTQKAQYYIKFFNKFAEDNKDRFSAFYVKSVDSVDEAKYGDRINDRIVDWNTQIKGGLNSGITFIDTYGITQGQPTLSNGYYRDEAQNQQVFDYILGKIGVPTNLQIREKESAGRDYTQKGVNSWGKDKEGKNVYYDENGQIVTNTWKDIDGATYYFDQAGHYYTGLHEFDGYTSFFNDAGVLTRGKTAKVDKEHYMLFDKDGKKVIGGWQEVNGKFYYIDVNGYAVIGWWKIQTTDYYFTEDGSVAKGVVKIGEDFYWFSDSGAAKVGWYEDNGDKYYFGNGGKMVHGEQEIGGKYYYFKEDGTMAKGWVMIDKNKYYYDPVTGEAANGRKNIDGKMYFFTEKGLLKSGWATIDGKTYYYDEHGVAYTGKQTIDGKQYLFDENGVALSGWQGTGANKRYYKEDTFEMATGWVTIKGVKYYFNEDGSPASGIKKVDSAYHFFSGNGRSRFSIPTLLVNLIIFAIILGVGGVVYFFQKEKIDPIVMQLLEKIKK